jgi:fructose-1,6-bisphosphatase/sedoheptulose 1,7-bisphosphatase-like protein
LYIDRPRHKKIIDELKDLNVNIKLITDGDVLGALYVSDPKYNVDMFLGIGGGPEGVLLHQLLMLMIVIFKVDLFLIMKKILKKLNQWV